MLYSNQCKRFKVETDESSKKSAISFKNKVNKVKENYTPPSLFVVERLQVE